MKAIPKGKTKTIRCVDRKIMEASATCQKTSWSADVMFAVSACDGLMSCDITAQMIYRLCRLCGNVSTLMNR